MSRTTKQGKSTPRESGKFVSGPAPRGGTFAVLEPSTLRFTVHRAGDGVEVDIPRGSVTATDTRAFTRRG
jgi:hypothetical protein